MGFLMSAERLKYLAPFQNLYEAAGVSRVVGSRHRRSQVRSSSRTAPTI